MRILLAHQGPPDAASVLLLTAVAWPRGSVVRVVTALDPPTGAIPTFPRVGEIVERWSRYRAQASADLESVVRTLRARGLRADHVVESGRPVTTIREHCRRFRPDLLVVGEWVGAFDDAPGFDVATELVDRAPCPILVARRPTVRHLVLCTDGSNAARAAERFVAAGTMFRRLPITVLSVVETHPVVAMLGSRLGAPDAGESTDRHERHLGFATEAAARLTALGRQATAQLAAGPIGSEVDEVVSTHDADLVVLGADKRRGWSRMLLGGVAREVLTRTRVSLLVVPESYGAAEATVGADGWHADRPAPRSVTPG